MVVTLDSKRRLTVPASLAKTAPGDHFEVRYDAGEDAIVFRRVAATGDWLAILRECPANMDDVPRRRRGLSRRRKL